MANKDRDAVNNGLNDLLGNVIRSDRERAGRGKAEAPHEFEAEVVDAPVKEKAQAPLPNETKDINTLTHYDTMTEAGDEEASPPPPVGKVSATPNTSTGANANVNASPRVPPKRKEKPASTPRSGSTTATTASRVETAQEMAETSTMTVTLRIPQGFNEWLDEYVHRSWPQKVRKQELVIEALKLLYARRGRAGEEVVPTVLLGEDDE